MAFLSQIYAALVIPFFWCSLVLALLLVSALLVGAAHTWINRHGDEHVWAMVRDAEAPLVSAARWRGYRIASQTGLVFGATSIAALAMFSMSHGGGGRSSVSSGVRIIGDVAPVAVETAFVAPAVAAVSAVVGTAVSSAAAASESGSPRAAAAAAPELSSPPLPSLLSRAASPLDIAVVAGSDEPRWSTAAASTAGGAFERVSALLRRGAALLPMELQLLAAAAAAGLLLWVARSCTPVHAQAPPAKLARARMGSDEIMADVSAMVAASMRCMPPADRLWHPPGSVEPAHGSAAAVGGGTHSPDHLARPRRNTAPTPPLPDATSGTATERAAYAHGARAPAAAPSRFGALFSGMAHATAASAALSDEVSAGADGDEGRRAAAAARRVARMEALYHEIADAARIAAGDGGPNDDDVMQALAATLLSGGVGGGVDESTV